MQATQPVKIMTSARNKFSTAMRASITGRNAAADAKDDVLYSLFDQAFIRASYLWNATQTKEEVQ